MDRLEGNKQASTLVFTKRMLSRLFGAIREHL